MTVADAYRIWEVGQQDAPPPALMQTLQPMERLLWAAEVPVSRSVTLIVLSALFGAATALLFFQMAPWSQSQAEYCAGNENRKCGTMYFVGWIGFLGGVWWLAISIKGLWKAKKQPWLNFFGITTVRALVINGNSHREVRHLAPDRHLARVDWSGSVRFDNAKTVTFIGLDLNDANRAVYWANEGRHRPEFQDGPAP